MAKHCTHKHSCYISVANQSITFFLSRSKSSYFHWLRCVYVFIGVRCMSGRHTCTATLDQHTVAARPVRVLTFTRETYSVSPHTIVRRVSIPDTHIVPWTVHFAFVASIHLHLFALVFLAARRVLVRVVHMNAIITHFVHFVPCSRSSWFIHIQFIGRCFPLVLFSIKEINRLKLQSAQLSTNNKLSLWIIRFVHTNFIFNRNWKRNRFCRAWGDTLQIQNIELQRTV